MNDSRYFIAKGKHLVVPVTKREYEDYWNKKRKEPITNEEWFNGLSTETKAIIIHLVYKAGYRDGCNGAETVSLRDIKKWLKQPHITGGTK